MATVFYSGGAATVSQVDSLTCTAAANGATITATMGTAPLTVSVTYTMSATDTTSTAAAALQALLTASTQPQFAEAAYSVSGAVITVTAQTAGTPFTLAASAGGGGAMARAAVTANSSPSDVSLAANWVRAGVAAIPVNGDDVVLQATSVPLLWNLTALAAVLLNTFTRWQSYQGQVGLPDTNANGYPEYRPKYLQLDSNVTSLPVVLGYPDTGNGPSLERYDMQSFRADFAIQGAGSASQQYNIYLLGTHVSNTLRVLNTTVAMAVDPAETSKLASALVDAGGTIVLGNAVTFSGTLTINNGSAIISSAPATVLVQNGSSLTVIATGLTYATLTVQNGSSVNWLSNSTITTFSLKANSTFDKSGDPRTMTITTSTVEGDSCQVNDPNSLITWTNPTTVNNQVTSGWYKTGPGRTWAIV